MQTEAMEAGNDLDLGSPCQEAAVGKYGLVHDFRPFSGYLENGFRDFTLPDGV